MNNQIEQWRSQAYAANVYHLSQQKGSRLSNLTRKEVFKGKAEFFDRLSTAAAQAKGARDSATPNLDITHSRRMLTTTMYEWATLVDRNDKLENIHDPENEYAIAARNALGRKMDDIILAGALGTAKGGEDGSTNVVLPNTQKVAAVSGGAISYLNVAALRAAKLKLDSAEVDGPRYVVAQSADLINLLSDTQVTSADYNTVRALVNGEVDTFLGFKFIHSERLPLATTYDGATFKYDTTTGLYNAAGTAIGGTDRTVLCFVGDGVIFGMQEGMKAEIGPRADKSYDMQVYASMRFGSTRMEDEKVVSIIVKA